MGMVGNLIRVSQEELDAFKKDSSLLESKVYEEESDEQDWYLYLDKTWEPIQYLLTGEGMSSFGNGQLGRVVLSAQILDEEQDLGYGPAHFLSPDQVIESNEALQKLDFEKVKKEYDGKAMDEKGIYPGNWDDSEAKEYVLEYFEELLTFYQKAADNKEAVLMFLS